ncbi:MAG: hypothetical protein AB1589_11125 [Cyanobacteriota bacterium]
MRSVGVSLVHGCRRLEMMWSPPEMGMRDCAIAKRPELVNTASVLGLLNRQLP